MEDAGEGADVDGEHTDGHTAEGNYNFISSEPSHQAGLSQVPGITQVEDETEEERVEEVDADELQILEEEDIAAARVGEKRVADADPVGTDEQVSEKRVPAAAKMKPRKEAKKAKKTGDAMVEVMQQYVNIKKKQAEDEIALLTKESAGSTNGHEFSISRCISLVHKMGDIARHERARAYKVFKNVENRETFITSAAEDEASAVEWLRSEMDELAT
ncbi:hypothetical protein D1007_06264 [Hordeum vulgare]|nr:hypothetical protein D1007_06264 [Hordeum vulgare]